MTAMKAPTAAWSSGLIILAMLGSFLISNTATAKPVTLDWDAVTFATKYELQITQDSGGASLQKPRTLSINRPTWKGNLSPGIYRYQVRAFDKISRAGEWSPSEKLVVVPEAPTLVAPESSAELKSYTFPMKSQLSWNALGLSTEGALGSDTGPGPASGSDSGSGSRAQYEVEITSDAASTGASAHSNPTTRDKLFDTKITKPLNVGKYQWRVRALIQETGGESHFSPWSNPSAFTIEKKALEKISGLAPKGLLPPPTDPRLSFRWKPIEGATHILFSFNQNLGKLKKTVFTKVLAGNETQLATTIPAGEGDFSWSVQGLVTDSSSSTALSSITAKPNERSPASIDPVADGAVERGPVAEENLTLNRNALFVEGTGYVAVSGMMAPYSYFLKSPATGTAGNVSSVNTTGRLTSEYWFSPHFALSPAADLTFFKISRKSFSTLSAELYMKYRAALSHHRLGWFLAPKFGVELRNFEQLIPPTATTAIDSAGVRFWGLGAGLDLRKQFTERWSLGGKFTYFFPISILRAPDAGKLTRLSANFRNLSAGLQGYYWFSRNLGLGVGGFFEQRSISYQRQSVTTSSLADEIRVDGIYFFTTLMYNFSK